MTASILSPISDSEWVHFGQETTANCGAGNFMGPFWNVADLDADETALT